MSENQHDYQRVHNPNVQFLGYTNTINNTPQKPDVSPVIPIVTDVYPGSQDCFSVERNYLPVPVPMHTNIPLPTCYHYPHLAVCTGHYAPVDNPNSQWVYNMNGGDTWPTGVTNIPNEKRGARCNNYNCACTPATTNQVWSSATNFTHYNTVMPSDAHANMVGPMNYTDITQNTCTNQKNYEKEVENFLKKITSSKKDGNIKYFSEPKNKDTSSSESKTKNTIVSKDGKKAHEESVREPRTSTVVISDKIDFPALVNNNKKAFKEKEMKEISSPKPKKKSNKKSLDQKQSIINIPKEKKKKLSLSLKKKTCNKEEETDKKSKKQLVLKNKVSKNIAKKPTVKKIDKIQKQLQLVEEEIKKRRIDLKLKEKEINDELKTKIKYEFVEETYIPPPKKTKIMIEENSQIIKKYKIDKRPLSTIKNEIKCNNDDNVAKQSIKTNKIKSVVKVPKQKVKTKPKTNKNDIYNKIVKRSSNTDLKSGGKSSLNFKEHSKEINIQYKDHSHNTNCNDVSVMIERGKEEENISSESNNTLELRIRLFTNPPQPVAQNNNCDVEAKENSSSSDLSFLDDIDVDEIVEILNISDEQNKNNEQNVSKPFTLNLIQKEQKLQTNSDNSNNNLPFTEQANKNLQTNELSANDGDKSALNQLPSTDVNYDELREILKMVENPHKLCTDESKSVCDDICYGDSEVDHDMGIFKELEEYRKQNYFTRAESEISDKTLVIDEGQYVDDVILIEDDVSKNIIEISEDHDEILTEDNTSGIENELMDEEATQRRVKTFLESIMTTINKPPWLQEDCKILKSQENSQLKLKDTKANGNENLTMPVKKKNIVQKINLTTDEDDIERNKVLVESKETIELDKEQHIIISTVLAPRFSTAVILSENSDPIGNEELQDDHKNGSADQAVEPSSHPDLFTNNQDDSILQEKEEMADSHKHITVVETKDQNDAGQTEFSADSNASVNDKAGYDSDTHNEQCSKGTITANSNQTLINEVISNPKVKKTIFEMDTEESEMQSYEENFSVGITATSNDDELIKATFEHAVVETDAEEFKVQSDKNGSTGNVSNVEELIKSISAKPIEENNIIEIVAKDLGIHVHEACSVAMKENKNQEIIKKTSNKLFFQNKAKRMVAEDPEINEGRNSSNVTLTADNDEEKEKFAKLSSHNTATEMREEEICSTGVMNFNNDQKLIKETSAKPIVRDTDVEMDAEVSEIEIDNVENMIKQSTQDKSTQDNLNNENNDLERENSTFEEEKIVDNCATVVKSEGIQEPKQETDENDVPKQPEIRIDKIVVQPDIVENNQADFKHETDENDVPKQPEIRIDKIVVQPDIVENNQADFKHQAHKLKKVSAAKPKTEQDKNIISDEINTENKNDNIQNREVENTSKTSEAKIDNGNINAQTKLEVVKKPNSKPLQTKPMVKNIAAISPGAISGESDEKDNMLANVIERRLFEYLHKKYSVKELIHDGNFSKVYLCESKTCETMVAKVLRKRRQAYYDGKAKEETLKDILQEHGDRTNIVKLHNGLSVDGRWCFLFEYYPQNLEQALKERKRSFHIDTIQLYARQLLTAVLFLRKHDQVHSAIKPGHILINQEEAKLKLCGFDEMCYIDQMDDSPNQGTVHYRPPEVILGYCKGFAIDVWSAALIIHEMATNTKLFNGTVNSEVLFQQMLNFGSVPPHMRRMSIHRMEYYRGYAFIRPVVKKDNSVQTHYISKHFNWTFKFGNKVLEAYKRDWARARIDQAGARYKVQQMIALLKDMLVMDPERRITIEFAYAHPFIYKYNSTRGPLLPKPY